MEWSPIQGKIARARAPQYEIKNDRNGKKPRELKKGTQSCT